MNSRFVISVFAVLFCTFCLLPEVSHATISPEQKDEAASLYDNGEYEAAYKQYMKLAKDGDTLAQYRVSYMKLTGLGTKEQAAEAMAWAVLASQGGDTELAKYRNAVTKMVPAKKRKSAERTSNRYLSRWGAEIEVHDSASAGASRTECTASRLKSNCFGETAKPTVHITWGEDLSEDPEQLKRIEELDREIVKNFSGHETSGDES